MAKRKTARPASRTRTPGAPRVAKKAGPRAAAARKTAAPAKGTARKATRKAAAPRAAARKSGPKNSSSQRRAVAPPAPKTATAPRTLRSTRKAATGSRSAARGGAARTLPRRDYGARGSATRLRQAERDRRIVEEEVPTPPSTLDLDRRPSAARSGRAELEERLQEHTAAGPDLTAGDVDADWQAAYNTGDEAPGGDMPTPDQAVVGEIGTAIGVEYADNEELKGVDKIEERDRHRWELDPASSEDYQDRARNTKKAKG